MSKLISVILAALIGGLTLFIVLFIAMCIADDESPIEVIKYYLPKKEVERENRIMDKSIAVVDTPKDCITCDLTRETWDEDMEEIIICSITLNEIMYNSRPSWCPLKPLPKKQGISLKEAIGNKCSCYSDGWNDCLKEILEEKDER